MSKHAKYSPSKLPRIIKCPGSVGLISQLKASGDIPAEEKSNPAAEEGSMLHKVMEEALGTKILSISQELIDKYNLTKEHVNACNECLDYVQVLKMKIPKDVPYYELIEHKVSLAEYSAKYDCPELNDVYGTADYVLTYGSSLIVLDWKFGIGIEVFPNSAQCKAYTLGALTQKVAEITIIIGQPRIQNEHFKELKIKPKDLYDWLGYELAPALRNINSDSPMFRPSVETCRWCDTRLKPHACKARLNKVQSLTAKAFAMYAKLPDIEEAKALEILKDLPMVEKLAKDIKLYVTNKLKRGDEVLGYKLVRGRSIRVFKKLDENKLPTDFLSWAEDHGFDAADFIISKPMSAPQSEKILTPRFIKKHPEFIDFIHKPEGKLTLVPEKDKREAVVFETTSGAFANFVEED